MQLKKVFDLSLLVGTVVRKFSPHKSTPSWEDSKDEARREARSIVEGLTLWTTIDIIVILALLVVSFFFEIPTQVIMIFCFGMVGCPLIMTLGIGYGCLKHLTFGETCTIVRDYYAEVN